MQRALAVAVLVAGTVAATSPVWAADPGDPSFTPDPARPGQSVSFAGSVPEEKNAGECQVSGSDSTTPSYSCTYAGGRFSGWVLLPDSATPGTPYALFFCGPSDRCGTKLEPDWQRDNVVGVATPTVVVPSVICSGAIGSREKLQGAGLSVAPPPFDFVVGSQAPAPGATVTRGAGATLYPARVPSVAGLSFASASALVSNACGTPVAAAGTAGVVRGQTPSAEEILPVDRRVHLVLAKAVPPPPAPWWHRVAWLGLPLALVLLVAAVATTAARRARRHPRQAEAQRPVPAPPPPPPPEVRTTRFPATYAHLPDPRSPGLTVTTLREPTRYDIEEIP